MSKVISELGLTVEQTRLLFSYQYLLTLNDVDIDKNENKKKLKKQWLQEWKKSSEDFINKQRKIDDKHQYLLTSDFSVLKKDVVEMSKSLKINTPLYLILMETTFFTPYYQLNEKAKKLYKGLKISKKEKLNELYLFAKSLNIEEELVDKYNSALKKSLQGLTKMWQKLLTGGLIGGIVIAVTAGFAAPIIGPLFAAEGLFGAAAISAGLAALGGGAIAAGGLGIAGGIAVIVGGGAILGAGAGAGVGSLLKASPDFALTQAAKLEVVMKEITLNIQKDIRIAQELIKEQRLAVNKYENELLELKKDREKNKEQIKNLAKSIKYLKLSIDRNENIFAKAAN